MSRCAWTGATGGISRASCLGGARMEAVGPGATRVAQHNFTAPVSCPRGRVARLARRASSRCRKPSIELIRSTGWDDTLNSLELQNHVAASDELAGRVIAITGASSGIGRAVALACARYGANVILIGRNPRQVGAVHT